MNSSTNPSLITCLQTAFRQVFDPEFGVSIQDLGLIYNIAANADGAVFITMSLTSRYCPAGDVILFGIQSAAEAVTGVTSVQIELVWEPEWTPERLSPAARSQLGWESTGSPSP